MFMAIRGATCAAANTVEDILEASKELLTAIMNQNALQIDEIIEILFSATKDLDEVYPARAARELGLTNAALMCFQEMHVKGSLQRCIRVVVHAKPKGEAAEHANFGVTHVYLREAAALRPDLAQSGCTPGCKESDLAQGGCTSKGTGRLLIAIDGPSGSGKSTVAKILASKLGIIYVDTGAMYRSVALYCLSKGVDPNSEHSVSALLDDINIQIHHENGEQRILLNGTDVTTEIRTQDIGKVGSQVAVHGQVREKLVALAKGIAAKDDCIMDGRDIGTVVMPDATLKIYLTSSPNVRASRRLKELTARGITTDYQSVLNEIGDRDYNDSHRKISPLVKTDDAIEVDSSEMSLDEVCGTILEYLDLEG